MLPEDDVDADDPLDDGYVPISESTYAAPWLVFGLEDDFNYHADEPGVCPGFVTELDKGN